MSNTTTKQIAECKICQRQITGLHACDPLAFQRETNRQNEALKRMTKRIAEDFKNRNKAPNEITVKARIPKHRRDEFLAIAKRMRTEG